jgi:hypothetical protein
MEDCSGPPTKKLAEVTDNIFQPPPARNYRGERRTAENNPRPRGSAPDQITPIIFYSLQLPKKSLTTKKQR